MAATQTFLQGTGNGANATTYTFSSQNLGTASADRYIAVSAGGSVISGTGSVSSVTVGGVSATQIISKTHSVNVANVVTLWIAAVPTGTTGDVVVTMSSASARCGITLWSVTGIDSATAYDSASNAPASFGTNPTPTTTIDCEADGIIIASSLIGNNATTSGVVWTGVTEKNETQVESNSYISGASDDFASSQTGRTITAAWTNNNSFSEAAVVVASWSPSGGGGGYRYVPQLTPFAGM